MDALGVQILGFQWWCLVTDGHEPCGYGGPLNQYGEGWYSEVAPTEALLEFPDNQAVRDYLMHSYPNSSEYKPCHHPGFWLEMVT